MGTESTIVNKPVRKIRCPHCRTLRDHDPHTKTHTLCYRCINAREERRYTLQTLERERSKAFRFIYQHGQRCPACQRRLRARAFARDTPTNPSGYDAVCMECRTTHPKPPVTTPRQRDIAQAAQERDAHGALLMAEYQRRICPPAITTLPEPLTPDEAKERQQAIIEAWDANPTTITFHDPDRPLTPDKVPEIELPTFIDNLTLAYEAVVVRQKQAAWRRRTYLQGLKAHQHRAWVAWRTEEEGRSCERCSTHKPWQAFGLAWRGPSDYRYTCNSCIRTLRKLSSLITP